MSKEAFEVMAHNMMLTIQKARKSFAKDVYGCKYDSDLDAFERMYDAMISEKYPTIYKETRHE